jgi:VanZ family protein
MMIILWSRAIIKTALPAKTAKKILFLLAIAGLIYAIGIEFIQHYFIPGRTSDWGDVMADVAGLALGVWFGLQRFIKK